MRDQLKTEGTHVVRILSTPLVHTRTRTAVVINFRIAASTVPDFPRTACQLNRTETFWSTPAREERDIWQPYIGKCVLLCTRNIQLKSGRMYTDHVFQPLTVYHSFTTDSQGPTIGGRKHYE